MNVRVEPEAENDIAAAIAWYEQQRKGLGEDFVAAVDEALRAIAHRPAAFALHPAAPDVRRAPLRRFPYVLVFQPFGEEVFVLACLHHRRNPSVVTVRLRRT